MPTCILKYSDILYKLNFHIKLYICSVLNNAIHSPWTLIIHVFISKQSLLRTKQLKVVIHMRHELPIMYYISKLHTRRQMWAYRFHVHKYMHRDINLFYSSPVKFSSSLRVTHQRTHQGRDVRQQLNKLWTDFYLLFIYSCVC